MKFKINARLLQNILWLFSYFYLATITIIYFILVLVIVHFFPNSFYILFTMGSIGFFTFLYILGSETYKGLAKFDNTTSKFPDEDLRTETDKGYSLSKNGHAPQTVFYRIYEVVAALSIYEASKGAVISPLSDLFLEPVEFLMFLIFIIISIQFIAGVSRHFESDFTFSNHVNVFAFINYILIVGEAVSLLGMGISVFYGDPTIFSVWFIALLAIDYIWILLFRIFRIGIFGFKNLLGVKINDIESIGRKDKNIYMTVNNYWISADIAFIIYLSIMEPVVDGYIVLPGNFFIIYFIVMIVGVFISTYINSKCLSELERI
jgi:hypothetical protein